MLYRHSGWELFWHLKYLHKIFNERLWRFLAGHSFKKLILHSHIYIVGRFSARWLMKNIKSSCPSKFFFFPPPTGYSRSRCHFVISPAVPAAWRYPPSVKFVAPSGDRHVCLPEIWHCGCCNNTIDHPHRLVQIDHADSSTMVGIEAVLAFSVGASTSLMATVQTSFLPKLHRWRCDSKIKNFLARHRVCPAYWKFSSTGGSRPPRAAVAGRIIISSFGAWYTTGGGNAHLHDSYAGAGPVIVTPSITVHTCAYFPGWEALFNLTFKETLSRASSFHSHRGQAFAFPCVSRQMSMIIDASQTFFAGAVCSAEVTWSLSPRTFEILRQGALDAWFALGCVKRRKPHFVFVFQYHRYARRFACWRSGAADWRAILSGSGAFIKPA